MWSQHLWIYQLCPVILISVCAVCFWHGGPDMSLNDLCVFPNQNKLNSKCSGQVGFKTDSAEQIERGIMWKKTFISSLSSVWGSYHVLSGKHRELGTF